MILMGDEVRQTQKGNNNAYAQDNEISWFDWKNLERHADLLRFTRVLVAARLQREEHGLTLNEWIRRSKVEWHGLRVGAPDWGASSRSISVTVGDVDGPRRFQVIANAFWEPLDFELAPPGKGGWRRFIDTALPSPEDIRPAMKGERVPGKSYRVDARAVVVLASGSAFGA
jgi:glycogen operon protein